MRSIGRLLAAMAIAIAIVFSTTQPAHAAYYNEYTTIALTPDTGSYTQAAAFAAGSTYLYSVKKQSSDQRAIIYRVNKDTGATTVMTNTKAKSSVIAGLGHANDMTIVDIAGAHHLFVVTLEKSGYQVVKLRYSGTDYESVASYRVKLNGSVKAVSGISLAAQSSTAVTFMFKSGSTLYRGTVGAQAATGATINLAKVASLTVKGAKVNGATVAGLQDFTNQGFYYDPAKRLVYYPLTHKNVSIVLVYRGVTTASTGALTSAGDLSFRITSSKYSTFEMESLGVSDGRLYFNANRKADGKGYDGVQSFDGYAA